MRLPGTTVSSAAVSSAAVRSAAVSSAAVRSAAVGSAAVRSAADNDLPKTGTLAKRIKMDFLCRKKKDTLATKQNLLKTSANLYLFFQEQKLIDEETVSRVVHEFAQSCRYRGLGRFVLPKTNLL